MKVHDPPMKFNETGQEEWDKWLVANSDDDYGMGILQYASEWATRMEAAIEAGSKLEDIAKSSQDFESGITGFMYGCAVSMMSQCWVHGEDLRRWHNLDTQIHDEGELANESGGTLNPALLNISESEHEEN